MISGGVDGGITLPPLKDGVAGALTGIAQAIFMVSAVGLLTTLAGVGAPFIALFALLFIVMIITIALLEMDNLLGKNAQECREMWFGIAGGILGVAYIGVKALATGGLAFLLQLLYSPESNQEAMECFG